MKLDDEGFAYPEIDKTICMECGLCERVCPIEHSNYGNSWQPTIYAAMLKDVEQRKRSSSGGIFYAIACLIVKQGGKVYGATMDDNLHVKHIGVDTLEGLKLLRGSKYVQSDLNDVFLNVRDELNAGRLCYFVGTPCQVAGLKSFLRKDYHNLLTSDLVCHGVPSQWLFDQHIAYLEMKYKGKVLDYQFRNNELWGGCEIFNLKTQKDKTKHYMFPSYNLSPYLYSFMNAMTFRYSCYDCKFARIPRQGDITLADYWGVKEFFPKIDDRKGVSLILVNTDKGRIAVKLISDDLTLLESRLEDCSKYNGNLVHISEKNSVRDVVYKIINDEGYASVAEKIFRASDYRRIRFCQILQTSPGLRVLWRIASLIRKWII